MTDAAFEAVIGLEIHVQLATATKLFCGDLTHFGAAPNTQVCPVCLGLPGALPVPNARAVELAVRAALALECTVHETSIFARKNYFYPDLPKGYQITQFEQPLATAGGVDVVDPADGAAVRVCIRRIHMEEDAGKSVHDRFPGLTAVDLNRTGVPLVEIVTEPDLHSPAAARAFLTRLKQTLLYVEVSDCDMEKGSLRVDANISVRRAGEAQLGVKTELKNMNSFANVERALEYEIARQTALVRSGGTVVQESLLWDAARGAARSMRSKEESHDYRYFPEPDLPPLAVTGTEIEAVRAALPELPAAREARFQAEYGLPRYDAEVLSADRATGHYFEAVAGAAGDAKAASNWVMMDVLGWLNLHGSRVQDVPVSAEALAALIRMVLDGTLSNTAGRRVFQIMAETGRPAAELVQEHGLVQVRDDTQLDDWVRAVIDECPDEVQRFRTGELKVMGYLMGQVMKKSAGRADPKRASELLRARLGA
ncbi:MAG: Asp-tRNA(Asn)/Glu-tRNA(Gln) amidotransferase subunit GatB [Gemmatimonadota bacterium]